MALQCLQQGRQKEQKEQERHEGVLEGARRAARAFYRPADGGRRPPGW